MRGWLTSIAMTILIASSTAQAGTCKDAMAQYTKQVAGDASTLPEVKERIKANILKSCAPGGFYEKLDEAIREAAAICRAHPDTKGC